VTPRPESPGHGAVVWRGVDGFRDLLSVHQNHPERYPFLLESVVHGTPQARYDILFAGPGARISQEQNETTPVFLERLKAAFEQEGTTSPSDCPAPFHGGWFLYLGYELARTLEPSLKAMPSSDSGWPVALAVRCTAAIVRDHETQQTWLVTEAGDAARLEEMEQDLVAAHPVSENPLLPEMIGVEEEEPALYLSRIARVQEYIRAGDTYQVNLSRRWRAGFRAAPVPAQLYARLRVANPAPFAGLALLGAGRAIVSSSPERLVHVRDGHISTRPIAGSWPRNGNATNDPQQIAQLRGHPKERAEHVMLVDLERNDLGRLCKPGSVRADDLLTVESYRHVHHLVSGVSGELRPEVTPTEVIRAVFPGGTITGCPKLRTMQIIAEQEGAARGAYTGSMGYLNRDGSMDLNILIRTLTLDGQRVEWRAGGGIVVDSDPQRELNETRAKAKGLLAALDLAGATSC
jgi:anthranilate synthase component I